MKQRGLGIKRVLAMVLLVLLTVSGNVQRAYALPVNKSPSSITITEGGSQVVTITLDEPIIGPGPDPPFFYLNLTSGSPSRVTTNVSTITYDYAEWAQSKTITISAVDDALVNGNTNTTVSFIVDSDSEYYNEYTGSIAVTVLDNDVLAQTTQTATAPASTTETLADTGDSTGRYRAPFLHQQGFLYCFMFQDDA